MINTNEILKAIKTLIEDNGNLHEQLYIGGTLGEYADIDCSQVDSIRASDKYSDMILKINGQPFHVKVEQME